MNLEYISKDLTQRRRERKEEETPSHAIMGIFLKNSALEPLFFLGAFASLREIFGYLLSFAAITFIINFGG